MATIIRGGFKDNKERLVTIDIYSPLGKGEYDLNDDNSPIKISFDSIDIEYDIDNMFEVIIKKTMSIDFITTRYFGDVLFSDRIKQVKVTVKLEGIVLFSGYVEPYTYSQDYSEKLNEFTLNCIDELGCLEYEYMYKHADWKNITNREQPISFKEYLSMILPTNTYYDMSKKIGNDSALDKLAVSQEIFLGDSENDMKNNEETLEIISKQWATVKDIRLLASVGNNKALQIKNEIQQNIKKAGFMTTTKIPMDMLVNYLGINVEYLKKISK